MTETSNDKLDTKLLEMWATDGGSIPIDEELSKSMELSITERMNDINERYPKLVRECDYETKLAISAWLIKHLVNHATEGGSFRHLIYNRLGFKADAYIPLYQAGGMIISNQFVVLPIEETPKK